MAAQGERIAILADVHANLAALRAILADAKVQGCTHLIVAGDIIGARCCPRCHSNTGSMRRRW